jgi:16S rRNA (uracil1498-N3)-methyltransferase
VAREWRRLLVHPARLAAVGEAGARDFSLEPAEAHYLRRVLRLRPGDRFAVIDGRGRLWSAQLQGPGQALLEQSLAEPLACEPAPAPLLELLVAPPKRDGDVLLRMACELGIDRLTLVRAERRVAGCLAADRAEAIVREACEQSERLWLPQLALDQELAMALGDGAAAPGAVETGIVAGLPGGGLCLLATTRRAQLHTLQQMLAATHWAASGLASRGSDPDGPARVRLAIGPEGGWSPAEETLALSRGWKPVSLGPTILRTSTAAVAAAAQLASWRTGLMASD